MKKLFLEAKRVDGPVLVHVITKKGAGYIPAERHPARFHGTEPFEIETGLPKKKRIQASYSDVFSTIMMKLADRNPKVVAITAAMPDGTGLKRFRLGYPERFFDVGIAEEHAVTFAAGMAKSGLIPVFVVYSSFLQRAYDQILHDVCLQKLPVVFAIDRAGLVGSDGETHQGIFDLSFLSTIPGMTILAPKNKWEFSDMMKYAVTLGAPVAIRYPRGLAYDGLKEFREPIEYGKSEMIYEESEIALFALGSMVPTAEKVREALKEKGHSCTLVNARFAAPFDKEMLRSLAKNHRLLVTMEENIKSGGLGEHIESFLLEENLDIAMLAVSIPDRFVEQGSVDELRRVLGIDAGTVTHHILEVL
jgi:1-deoxy-D-xylulose-5-phosphate synthase